MHDYAVNSLTEWDWNHDSRFEEQMRYRCATNAAYNYGA